VRELISGSLAALPESALGSESGPRSPKVAPPKSGNCRISDCSSTSRISYVGALILRSGDRHELHCLGAIGGIVSRYASCYKEARTHLSLARDAPISRPIERFGRLTAEPIVGGPYHRYARM
jgi:hypothetical protein